MKVNYWNIIERGKIDAIRYSNPEEAIRRYEKYIEKYPRDYEAKIFCASVYITIKEFDYAYDILEATKKEFRSNRKVIENQDVLDYLEEITIKQEMRYYAYTEQLYKLYDLFFELTEDQKNKLDYVKFYCYSKLGYISAEDESNLKSYTKRQILSYDENLFREFINIHRYGYNENLDEQSDKIFDRDFPFEKVLEEVKRKLDYEKCICNSYNTDQYVFKYDVCGKDNGVSQNYFKVICLHNTNNILTIFPASECERLDYVDLNYLNKKHVSSRPSQIDKFYKKFKNHV